MVETALPPFDQFRLATAADLPRIATVAAAGFFWSPTFQFQRPYHGDFPEDTLSSYWEEYQSALEDPATVVLVAEDVWNPAEREGVYESLRKSPMYSHGADPRVSIIVGVCSINLKPGSSYVGLFQVGYDTKAHVGKFGVHAAPGRMNTCRDQSAEAGRLYAEATAPAKTKHLAGLMRLSTLTVHPTYWNRGHATRLVTWCTRLADMDDAPVGVSAVPMGATLAAKAGFKDRETVKIRSLVGNATSHVGDFELWIAVRQPAPSLSDASTTSSSSSIPGTQ